MTTPRQWYALAALLVPGGLAVAALAWLLRCRHRHELWARRRDQSGVAYGELGRACIRCGHWHRPDLGDAVRAQRLTAPREHGVCRELELAAKQGGKR